MLENYLKFLEYLTNMLNKQFSAQAPFMACKKGCAKCCQNGDYPFSEIEIKLLKQGFSQLSLDKQNEIKQKIKSIVDAKTLSSEKEFTYECPFLCDDVCSVYDYRGIICRTFGLIYINKGGKMQIPFCAYEGLNYSNVLDEETNQLSLEKMAELGIEQEPKAYNIRYDVVTADDIAEAFGFNFGKKTSLIDLLSRDDVFKL